MTVQTDQGQKTHLQTHENHPDIPVGWAVSSVGNTFLARRHPFRNLTENEIYSGLAMSVVSKSRAGILVQIRMQITAEADYKDDAERLKDSGSCREY